MGLIKLATDNAVNVNLNNMQGRKQSFSDFYDSVNKETPQFFAFLVLFSIRDPFPSLK